MELAIVAAISGIGYYLNKDGRKDETKIQGSLIPENQKPSADNIYHNRHADKVHNDEFRRATAQTIASLDPDKTGIIPNTYKNIQNNKYDRRIYSKSDRIIQREEDLIRSEPNTTTRFPSSTLSTLDISYGLIDADYADFMGTQKFNDKRNNIPNPKFETIKTNDGRTIVKSLGGQKSVQVYAQGGHNNMEPFFGSTVKQNMRADANRTLLQHHTGANPVFRHKKEVKRMFAVQKNPFVNGMPVATNREVGRYIPSIKKRNILPFEQQRIAPGLNKKMTDNTSNIGFHDPYRPLGQGKYKPINELRVNPKLTYKGKITGEKFFVAKQQRAVPVFSRRQVDLSYTTMPGQKEGFGDYKYRGSLPSRAQVQKGQILVKDTIILKHTDRVLYSDKLGNLQGHSGDVNGNKEYVRGEAWYAKDTVRQDTEDHIHNRINRGDGDRGPQIYQQDGAQDTVRQQTEDAVHSHINRGDGDRGQRVYQQDDAKTTLKQQTLIENYVGVMGSGESGAFMDQQNYANAEINGLKEATLAGRAPTLQGAKINYHKEQGANRFDTRKTQYDNYDKTRRVRATSVKAIDKRFIGQITNQPINVDDKGIYEDRINPYVVSQFEKNPYSQSLSSYIYPQNPRHHRK